MHILENCVAAVTSFDLFVTGFRFNTNFTSHR